MKELLVQALESPHGIIVKTNNPSALKTALYAVRREYPLVFDDLSFCTSRTDPEGEVWIVKQPKANADAEET